MATLFIPEALQAIHRIDTPAGGTVGIQSSGWCQRRYPPPQHIWHHISEGELDTNPYVVAPLAEHPAREFIEAHHYNGSWPAAELHYGLRPGSA